MKKIAAFSCLLLIVTISSLQLASANQTSVSIHSHCVEDAMVLPSYSFACPEGCNVLGEIEFENSYLDYLGQQYVYCLRCPKCGVHWFYAVPINIINDYLKER